MKKALLDGTLSCIHQGKVRDTYALPEYPTLRFIHVTDRVSTHNVSHKSLIPSKGEVLLAITLFWERLLRREKGTFTHTVAFGPKIYDYLPQAHYPADLHLQAIVVRSVQMFPYEFVYRSRMAGSLWKDFYSQGKANPYGLTLPEGMDLMDEFPQAVFTPTDKSATDDPVAQNKLIGITRSDWQRLRDIYTFMRCYALKQGIDIIDTKLEAGLFQGRRTLADEWGTPDSSRFVDAASVIRGQEPRWLDKEFLRQEAEAIWKSSERGKFSLHFSEQAVTETVSRYHEIVERLTGLALRNLQVDLGMT